MGKQPRFQITFGKWVWLGVGINTDFGLEIGFYIPFVQISWVVKDVK